MSKTASFIGVCVCVYFLNMKFYYVTLADLEITMLESGLELMKS